MTHISGTTYGGGIEVTDFVTDGLDASERIGRVMEKPRASRLRRLATVVGLGSIGAASYAYPSYWQTAWTTASPLVNSIVETARTQPTATAVSELPRSTDDAAPQRVATVPAERPQMPVVEAPAAQAAVAPPPAPLAAPTPVKSAPKSGTSDMPRQVGHAYAAPKVVEADPLARRAEAAGLHPDLSRTLLQKLSETDFKTAATAINKALSEVGDTEALVWPPRVSNGATRFRISFVQGAPQDCRRYVVEIAKDGWQTTALPVEKCGVKRRVAAKG